MPIRSFIAIPAPKELANALGDAAATMAYQDKSGAVRWVDQGNYHITLAFLGDQHEADLEELADQLDTHLTLVEAELAITHLSPFPEGKPKLIAAMVDKKQGLLDLHKQVISSLVASPIEVEKRRFIPHITLGRYRHTKNHFAGAIPSSVALNAAVEEVAIYQSTLTPSGAEYEAIFRFPLLDFEFHEEISSYEV